MRAFKRTFLIILACLLTLCLVLVAGCSSTEISFYIDGNGNLIEVQNGEETNLGQVKGDDGQDIDIKNVYDFYLANTPDDQLSFDDFLNEYLTLEAATDSSKAINKALASAIKVYSEYTSKTYVSTGSSGFWGGSNREQIEVKSMMSGSGICYKIPEDGDYIYFLTNYHVVYYTGSSTETGISDNIHIYLYGSESSPEPTYYSSTLSYVTEYTYDDYAIPVDYCGGSITSDIAILRAKKSDVYKINSNIQAVTFAVDDNNYDDYFHVGDTAIAIGNSEGYGISVTQGIVSVDSEYISLSIDGTYRSYRSIRIDTAIYQGNSGGGLFNKLGQLIGIVNAGNTSDESINYAIPLSIVKGTADNIIYYFESGEYSVTNPYYVVLGITVQSMNSQYVYNSSTGYGTIKEDSVVSEITEGSIGSTWDLQTGDKITNFIVNDSSYDINRMYELRELLLTVREGDAISVTYTRDGQSKTTQSYTITESDLTVKE